MKKTPSNVSWFAKLWQQHWYWIVFTVLIMIASVLRFYKLADVPHGMTWDEAAIGYNGFAIWKAHRDEWIFRMPISFRSFGDYKAPLAIYISAVFSGVLGLSLWTLRLPFALAGVAAVAGLMLWLKLWLANFFPARTTNYLSLLAGGLLTISAWHLHFSRAGFESGMAMTWIIWAMVFFMASFTIANKAAQKQHRVFWQMLLMTASGCCFVASIYTYHSAKVFVPGLAIILLALYWRQLLVQRFSVICAAIISALLTVPFVLDTVIGHGGERFTQASIFSAHATPFQIGQALISHFVIHLTPWFLVMGQTTTLRHGDGHFGVLYWPSFLVMVVSGVLLLVNRARTVQIKQVWVFGLVWALIGILPAAIGVDVPHSNRALLALPGFIILTVSGLQVIVAWLDGLKLNAHIKGSHGEDHLLRKSVIGTFLLLEIFCFAAYTRNYYTQFAAESAGDWVDGYLEAMQVAAAKEPNVDKILFTNKYQQPYIYALFVRKTDPVWYQGGSLIKYEFTDKISVGDFGRKNTLIIASPEQLDPRLGQQLIYGSDGKVKFVIRQTDGQL